VRRAALLCSGALVLLLAACGKQGELMPKAPPGQTAKVDPTKPLPSSLLVRPTQDEPARIDDPLSRSQERRDDRFNLPPPGQH
jgi:hypothetical protein